MSAHDESDFDAFLPRAFNFDDLLELTPSSIYWKNLQGVYLGCNSVMLKMVGVSSVKEIIGKTDYDLSWKRSAKQLHKNDEKVIKSRKLQHLVETGKLADGTVVTVISNKMPIFNKVGKVIGIIGSSIDITELKKTQQQLEEVKVREAHFKAMSALGGMMAHELRTPLTSIGLNSRIIKKCLSELIKAYREYYKNIGAETILKEYIDDLNTTADDIEQAARYANNTISTILAGFHYSASEKVSLEEVDVTTVIQQALLDYPLSEQERSLITFSTDKKYKALASSSILIHVFHNLLKNALYAIQAADKGTIVISVKRIKGGFIHIEFKDTAKGMSDEIRKHIFEPFYTTKDSETTIGLGLYFCKMALEKMDASITCDSKLGEYTIFTIHLKALPS